ncbi:hypothetical protein PP707_01045 [Acetobacter pasteurianus]|nr:hypothetical protein [Acetobacter pasteurianus]
MGWRRQEKQQQLDQQKILKEKNPDNSALSHEDIREEQVFTKRMCTIFFFLHIDNCPTDLFGDVIIAFLVVFQQSYRVHSKSARERK